MLQFCFHFVFVQVSAFCDVDNKKIAKGFYIYEESKVKLKLLSQMHMFTITFNKLQEKNI